jgi:tetratricopeptide (TPR) repeat protein
LRELLARTDVRFALACAVLLVLAVLSQFPAARLHAESRLLSSPFRFSGEIQKRELERRSFTMYLPRKGSLRFASLGNSGLAADYVWIRAAGYVTREFGTPGVETVPRDPGDRNAGAERKFAWLSKLYNTVHDLDPHWVGSCRLSAMILAAVGSDPSGAIDLLERGVSANPDSWLLPYEAGVTMLMWPGHAKEAVRYFRTAARLCDDPERSEAIKQIIPRLEAEAGRLEEAIREARKRALAFEGQPVGKASERQLTEFVARQLELDLQETVKRFSEREGRLPADIAELRRAGLLAEFDFHFSQARVVFGDRLRELLDLFRRTNPQAPPLEGLKDFTPLARSGFLHGAVSAGLFEPPEWRDTFGKPFLYHAPTGTVRSEGLAEAEASSVAAILSSAVSLFARRKGGPPGSLRELAEHFGEMIREGRQLPQPWGQLFKSGRPPEHPLALWGWEYVYEPATGRVEVLKERGEDDPAPAPEPVLTPPH